MSSYDSLVARMAEHAPDFKGYRDAENRRDSDKIARETWANELRFSIDTLAGQLKANSKLGDSKKQVAETVIRKLTLLVEAFNLSTDDKLLFLKEKLREDDIESILTLDLNLLARSTAIKEK